jgi:hypothetical protein
MTPVPTRRGSSASASRHTAADAASPSAVPFTHNHRAVAAYAEAL